MANTKSIIDIQINDANFKQFVSLFNQYTTKLQATPVAWKGVAQAIQQGTKGFQSLVAEQAAAIGQARLMETAHKAALKLLQEQETVWQRIERHGKTVSTGFKETIQSLGSLKALGLGLLGAGTLYGLEHLASGASDQRKSASALGISPGEKAAADISYKRFFLNPGEVLNNIANAQGDKKLQSMFSGFNINPDGKNPAQLMAELLPKLKYYADNAEKFGGYGALANLPHFQIAGVGQGDLRILHDRKQSEVDDQVRGGKNTAGLGASAGALKAFDDFNTNLEGAAKKLNTIFIEGLAPLAPSLIKASNELIKLADAISKSDGLKWAIESLAGDIKSLTDFIKNPWDWAKKDIAKDTSNPKTLVGALANASIWNAYYLPGVKRTPIGSGGDSGFGWGGEAGPQVKAGPRVKAGSGKSTQAQRELAALLQQNAGAGIVTAFNDGIPQHLKGPHSRFDAIDFRSGSDPMSEVRQMNEYLKQIGSNWRASFERKGENNSTNDHIHIQVVVHKTPGTEVATRLGPKGG